MPDLRRANCQSCGKPSSEAGPISWRGNCRPCGLEREAQAILEQVAHSGPIFQHWRRRIVASAGGVLLDDQPGER